MADIQWFYVRNGQQAGPVSADAIRQLLASGQVGPADLVWREGMADWQPAGNIPELGAAGVRPDAPTIGPGGPPMGPPGAPTVAPGAGPYGAMPTPGQFGVQPTTPLPYSATPVQGPAKGTATAALVVAIIGLFCGGAVLGIIAVILAVVSQNTMKRTGNYDGKGLSTAGLIIGIVDIVISVGWLAAMFSGHHARFHF